LDPNTHIGPLKTKTQVETFKNGVDEAKRQGGKVLCGGTVIEGTHGNFVTPTIIEIDAKAEILQRELFVPILYIAKFSTIDEAITLNNNVPHGLTSSIFTRNLSNHKKWIGPLGSDAGCVLTNISPNGEEIGGAFGGEKETGGGRVCGGESWKGYMRRSTCTVNYGNKLPLA